MSSRPTPHLSITTGTSAGSSAQTRLEDSQSSSTGAAQPPYTTRPNTHHDPEQYAYAPQSSTSSSYSPSPLSGTASQTTQPLRTQRRAITSPYPLKATPTTPSPSPSSPNPFRFFGRNNTTGPGSKSPGYGGQGAGVTTGPAGNGKRLGEVGRRYSGEKSNVYTACGRHSDEWLFGPMKGAVRKIWEQKSPGPEMGTEDKGSRAM